MPTTSDDLNALRAALERAIVDPPERQFTATGGKFYVSCAWIDAGWMTAREHIKSQR